jgi:GNAT superfamily N-acetyltransferase
LPFPDNRREMPDLIEATREAEAVRRAGSEDLRALAGALARAFYDDPVARWMMPRHGRRDRQLERGFAIGLRGVYLRDGDCWTTPGVTGAALWLSPGRWRIPALRQLRLLPPMARIYGRDLPRALRTFALLESEHPKDKPHWYLPFIGVDPDWQGRGIGTALLRPVLERCDREGLPAYLEASSPRNRACYERNGFRVTGEIGLPSGPTMWKMWREPGGEAIRLPP